MNILYTSNPILVMEFAKKFKTEKAEKLNGKDAMLGIFALVGAYFFTDQIVPGIFYKISL